MKKLLLSLTVFLFVFGSTKTFSQTSWKGVTSTNWATATNWTAGVPLATTDVIIGDASFTGTFQPAISATAAAKTLTIGGAVLSQLTVSSTLTVKGDININSNGNLINGSASISLTGNWSNNGSYNTNSVNSTVIFNGTLQSLGGSVQTTFRKLTINTGSILTLNSNINCSGASSLLTVSGTLNPNESPTCLVTADNLTLNNAAVLKVNASLFASNYIISTTFLLNAGCIVEYSATTTDQTISSSYTYSTLRISGAGRIKSLAADLPLLRSTSSTVGYINVLSGTLDLAGYTANRGATVAGGVLSVSNAAFLKIGGTGSFPANYTTITLSLTSTVEYNGTDQPVSAKTYGNLVLSSAAGAAIKTMPPTAFTVAGSFTSVVGAGTAVSYTAASNISVTGSMNIGVATSFSGAGFSHSITGNWNNSGTFSPGTSTITLKGTGTFITGNATQDFNNLSFTGSNISAPAITNINVSGNLATSGSGAFTQPAPSILTMSGTTKTITGINIILDNLDITGVITTTATATLTGNLSVSGSLTATSGVITMNGMGKTITNSGTLTFKGLLVSGNISTTSNFTISYSLTCNGTLLATAGTVTFISTTLLSGTVSLNNITINGTSLALAANSILALSGAFVITAGSLNVTSYIPNTVNYNGTGAQTIKGTGYNNLTLSNGNTKTAGAVITVNNALTISPSTTFNPTNFTITIVKSWINNGVFTAGSGLVQFTGATSSSITGATTFNNVTVNKTLATYTVNLQDNITVSTINMNVGGLNTGSNTLTITTTRTGNGIILGTITRTHAFVPATAYAFEGPNNLVTFAAGMSGVTSVTVNIIAIVPANFPYNGSIGRYYTISIPSGTYTATLRLHYEDAELNGNDETVMQLWKYDGANWTASGKTSNSSTSNYVEKTGLTNITGSWTMTDDGSVFSWNGSVSSDWNTAANWTFVQGTPGSVPTSTDIVQLGVNLFTNQPIITTAASIKSLAFGSAQAVTLTLNGGGILTANGSVNGNWSSNVTHTINANNQTITINGDLVLSDNTINHSINLNIATGTVSVLGTLTQSGGASIVFSAAGTLNIGKDFIYSSGTFTPATGTVRYNGTTSQNVAIVPYNNLTIIKTAGTIASLAGTTTLAGSLVVTTGEFDIANTLTINGSVTISTTALFDANASVINVGGSWTKSATGTFNTGSGTVNFNGSGTQTISAGAFNILTINKISGTVLLSGNNTVNGDLSLLSGTLNLSTFTLNQSSTGDNFIISDAATLLISGGNNFPTNFSGYVLSVNSLVHYNGTIAQSVANIPYGNISFSNGGALTKTLLGSCTVNGNLTLNSGASLDPATYTLTLQGNWNNSGNFIASTSTVILNGGISGTNKLVNGPTSFYNFIVTGYYALTPGSNLIFLGDFEVSGFLESGFSNKTFYGNSITSGVVSDDGISTFMGTQTQYLRFTGTFYSPFYSSSVVFKGTIAPISESTSPPTFINLEMSNTSPQGLISDIGITVLGTFLLSTGCTWNGGNLHHTFMGPFFNNGTILSSGTITFAPGPPLTSTPSNTIHIGSGSNFQSTGTVEFGGATELIIDGAPALFNNVIISNTNSAGITPVSNWNMTGKFSINSNAIFNAANFSHSVGGNMESDGTLNGNNSSFTMASATGQISGSPTTVFHNFIITGSVSSNSDFSVDGDFINNGMFDGAIGAVIMTGSNPSTIGGTTSPSPIAQLSINKTGGAIVTDNVNIGNITALIINSGTLFTSTYSIAQNPAGGVIIVMGGATLKLGGTNTIPAFSGYGFDVQSTVEYAGTTQTIANGPVYGNLTISAAGNKTSPSFLPLTVAGNFSITAGNFVANNNTHSIAGNWLMTGGTFNNTNSIIRFNGTTDQTIQTITPFNNVTINKTTGLINLLSDVTVNAALNFIAGKIQTANHNVIIASTGSLTGAGQSTGWVKGNLQKNVATGSAVSRTFEVGDANNYTPATVQFATVSIAGNLTGTVTTGDHSQVDYSGIDSNKSVNRFWSLTNAGIAFTTATSIFNWVAPDLDAGTTTANFKTASYNAGAWTLNNITSPLSTSIQSTGLTGFGDFAIGERVSQYKWSGEAFTADWNTARNWTGGMPNTSLNALIPNGITGGRVYPVLNAGTGTVNNLTIESSATLTVTSTLQIAGTISNSGIFDVSDGTVEFNGSSAQTIPSAVFANNKVKNITISNNVSLSDRDTLTGTLRIAAGKTFTTNDNLILHSDANGTARIAELPVDGSGNATAFITGFVNIERHLPMRKAWRLLSTPVKPGSSPTINAAWQEGVSSALINNPNPGYGVMIQGGAANNGFDLGLTTNATIKIFNNASGNFIALPPIPGTLRPITDYTGYFLYVRGDRSIDLMQGNSAAITPTTLRMQGEINTGKQTSNVNATGYTILGNPFPSSIDFETLTKNNVKNSFYVWDPKLAGTYGLGAYVTFSWNSGTGMYDATTAASPLTKYIPSGEAIIIESADGINPGTITVKESDKSSNGSDAVFGKPGGIGTINALNQQVRVNLFAVNADASRSLLDAVLTTYNDRNFNVVDGNDAKKLNGASENIGIRRENKMLAIERRKTITVTDTTYLNIYQVKIANYELQITADNMNRNGITAVIKDKYSNTINNMQLDMNGTTKISFSVNADPASYAINRFSIVFLPHQKIQLAFDTHKAYRQQKDVAVEWKVENESNVKQYEVERSANGVAFTKINTTEKAASKNETASAYKIIDNNPIDGDNYYRIRYVGEDGAILYSDILKVGKLVEKAEASFIVYPNPVIGNTINIQFANIEKGNYTLQLFNIAGQLVASKSILHDGTKASQQLVIPQGLAAGKYDLKLAGGQLKLTTTVIKK